MQLELLKSLIGENEDDQVLKNFLRSSKRLIEGYLGYNTDYGNHTITAQPGVIYLPYAPVVSVEYIRDTERKDVVPIVFNKQKGILIVDEAIEIRYTGGMRDGDNENFDIAVAIMASHLYNRRSSIGIRSEKLGNYTVEYTDGLPPTVLSLLSGLKRI